MPLFEVEPGDAPLVLSFPHAGSRLPDDLARAMLPAAHASIDTDWNVDRLYAFAPELGIGTIRADVSRYAVDLNRDPTGTSLYPGARTTGVCPTETFAGEPLYAPEREPSDAEVAARVATYWRPYHDALARELDRVRRRHGYALLVDGHSIFGRLPLLFPGELPDVNLGTNDGASCPQRMTSIVAHALARAYPALVVNGRFKGGYITRTYGRPAHDLFALQIELNQRTYLANDSRTRSDPVKAARLTEALRDACTALLAWRPAAHVSAFETPATTVPAQSGRPSQ